MKRILLIASILSCIAWGPVTLGGGVPAPSGSTQTNTLFDDFSTTSPNTGAEYDGMSTTCVVDEVDDELDMDGTGSCKVDLSAATPPGAQPSSPSHWMIFKGKSPNMDWAGAGLRVEDTATPTVDDHYYIFSCDNQDDARLWTCEEGGDECRVFWEDTPADNVCSGNGDILGFAVAGTAINTEFCMWIWQGGSGAPTINDSTVPDDWGTPFTCLTSVAKAGTNAQADLAGVWANGQAWDLDPDAHINSEYSNDATNCAVHSTAGVAESFVSIACGNL